MKPHPSIYRLKQVYQYDELTGHFYFKINVRSRGKKGAKAGFLLENGYWSISLDGISYRAHRLAWFYIYERWPFELDHKDGNRSNNSIKNLRVCTSTQNKGNSEGWGNKKKSKLPRGVFYLKNENRKKKYWARIWINYKQVSLGVYFTPNQAAQAYHIAAKKHFGEFSK